MIRQEILEGIMECLLQDNLKKGLEGLENYLLTYPHPSASEQLQIIMADYKLMKDYWQRGFADPQRTDVYKRLVRQAFQLATNISIHYRVRNTASLSSMRSYARSHRKDWSVSLLRQDLENFVSNVAMLELEPANKQDEQRKRLYQEHYEVMRDTFNYIVTSKLWNDGKAEGFRQILLSPTIDTIDQQLIVSAITLSLLQAYDINKLLLLMIVYNQSRDEAVRQRALVGWVFGLKPCVSEIFTEQDEAVKHLLAIKRNREEIIELQKQLVFCLKTEDDTRVMHDEIIPELMKGNHLRVTRDGIEETEEDPLENILRPEESERRMERMEAAMSRMAEMQRTGADIYFGGFAQMKRFPFFYDTCNWLMPFYEQHPGVEHIWQKSKVAKTLKMLMNTGPFCDSDKYSLALAFGHVVDKLPANFIEMMERGEARMAEVELNDEDKQRPEYLRRIYLQSLYRFFKLLPQRNDFLSPFDEKENCSFILKSPICLSSGVAADLGSMAKFFFRQKMYEEAEAVLSYCTVAGNVELQILSAKTKIKLKAHEAAKSELEEVLEREPGNEQALALYAKCETKSGHFDKAAETYKRLYEMHGDKNKYLVNWAICKIQEACYEEVVEPLYELHYNHAENQQVMHVLAWALVGAGKLEQAEKMYARLVSYKDHEAIDWLNYGYCLWLKHDIEKAADMFKTYADSQKGEFDPVREFFDNSYELLTSNGINDVEIWLMTDLLESV